MQINIEAGELIEKELKRLKAIRGLSGYRQQIKFWLRCCVYRRIVQESLAIFHRQPFLAQLLQNNRGMATRALRSYILRLWSPSDRVKALAMHHQHLAQTLRQESYQAIYDTGINLYTEETSKGTVQIALKRSMGQGREGELNLEYWLDEHLVHLLTFTLIPIELIDAKSNPRMVAIIGCSKSSKHQDNLALIKALTKIHHGLWPKVLLLRVLGVVLAAWKIRDVFAVTNHGMVLGGKRLFRRNKPDYDRFWESCDGIKINKHVFYLPQDSLIRDLADVPSHKRSSYRKRNEYVLHLAQETQNTSMALIRLYSL